MADHGEQMSLDLRVDERWCPTKDHRLVVGHAAGGYTLSVSSVSLLCPLPLCIDQADHDGSVLDFAEGGAFA